MERCDLLALNVMNNFDRLILRGDVSTTGRRDGSSGDEITMTSATS